MSAFDPKRTFGTAKNLSGASARCLSSDGLAYFEAFKFRMLQIERSSCLVTGTRMRGPEFFRFGPRLKGPLALPHCMRGIERMVFRLWAPKQMKLQETRNTIEIRIAPQPYSKASSEPFFTRNRFMAMNICLVSCACVLVCRPGYLSRPDGIVTAS